MLFKNGVVWLGALELLLFAPLTFAEAANIPRVQAARQIEQTLKSTAEPGRAGQTAAEEAQSITNNLYPGREEGGGGGGGHGTTLPPETAKIKFHLKKIQIINPIVFSPEELLQPYYEHYGKEMSLGELQTIANQLTEKYQKAGYVLTHVILPAQKIENGIAKLQVVAGFIDKIEVSGKKIDPKLKELILQYGEHIRNSIPLKMEVIERYTLLANDIPGITVNAVLKPSKTTSAAADLVFVVEKHLEYAYISVNTFGTRFLGSRQYLAGLEEDSLFSAGDATQVQMLTTGDAELNYAELRHTLPVGSEGMRFGTFGRFVRSEPGSILGPFDPKGKNRTIGTELFYPVLRSRKENFFIQGGFMSIDSKADLLGAPFYADRIRPFYASVIYNRLDKVHGINHGELTFTKGFKILKASGSTNISRLNGKSEFTKINTILTRQQPLPKNFSVFMAALGQYSYQALLSVSQFGFGGSELGRGYDPSEILGDRGVSGTVELRYDGKSASKVVSLAQYYLFYDAGQVWHTDPVITHDSATSAGFGVRLFIMEHGKANFFLAKPLTRKVLATGNRHMRAFFSITLHM